jgi:DNA-binding MarR family transcriptional regulator
MSTMSPMRSRPGEWLDDREQAAWRGFITMHARLVEHLNRELRNDSGLSGSDYAVLVELSEKDRGRLRAFELGDRLGWDKSRLSRHLTRMEQRRLVAREDCPTDARGSIVVLTRQGRRAIEGAAPDHVDKVRRWFLDALTDDQLDAVVAISGAVLAHLERGVD